MSKLTGAGRNGYAFAPRFFDYLAAMKSHSIFWTFLSDESYYDKTMLSKWARIGILAVNVWHFFILKGCFKQCVQNLIGFVKLQPDLKVVDKVQNARLTIEVLVIGFISGVALMPGAHPQF